MEPFLSWAHFEVIATTVGLIIIPLLSSRRADRKDRDERDERREIEQERRHKENQDKLDDLLTAEKYLPQHYHAEKGGALTTDGIIRKRTNGS